MRKGVEHVLAQAHTDSHACTKGQGCSCGHMHTHVHAQRALGAFVRMCKGVGIFAWAFMCMCEGAVQGEVCVWEDLSLQPGLGQATDQHQVAGRGLRIPAFIYLMSMHVFNFKV